jgi:hypothetical protein
MTAPKEVDMAGTAVEVDWPTLLWRRQQQASGVELARDPTWPAALPAPGQCVVGPQPNLYLQLTQILEWEIWNHNQTRAQLAAEYSNREELDARVWQLSHDLEHWQHECQQVYTALGEHRAQYAALQRELEAATALRQPEVAKIYVCHYDTNR